MPIGYRQKVKETYEIADRICNEKETKFLKDMLSWSGDYTQKQRAWIDALYVRACASPW